MTSKGIFKAFEESIELERDYFGPGEHRGYHPVTKTRMAITEKGLDSWFITWVSYMQEKGRIRYVEN